MPNNQALLETPMMDDKLRELIASASQTDKGKLFVRMGRKTAGLVTKAR
jgi:hypothetical protein